MSDDELRNKYKALENHVLELIIRYIDPHKNTFGRPDEYKLDVHSFCILCHAAFEEFIEDVTLYSVDRIEREFNSSKRKFSFATLCLLHFDETPKKLYDDRDWPDIYNDYLSKQIKKRKTEMSKYATQENHGIDIKY